MADLFSFLSALMDSYADSKTSSSDKDKLPATVSKP